MGLQSVAAFLVMSLAAALAGCAPGQQLLTTSALPNDVPPSDQRPSDEPLQAAKEYYDHSDYGLAEKNFRAAAEANPKSIDAWVGLAASYDRLHRFDLADRAYAHALALAGQTPEMLNNLGYHYMLMGDLKRARQYLESAAAKEPGNPYIQGNLALLQSWKTGGP